MWILQLIFDVLVFIWITASQIQDWWRNRGR